MDVPHRPTEDEYGSLPVLDLEEFARRGRATQAALDAAVDTIGDHLFVLGETICMHCGLPIEKAATSRCGPS